RAEEKTAYHPPSRDWDMDPDLREGLDDAWDSIQRHDPKSARFTLRYMQSRYPENADIWYLFALATDNPKEKMLYLENALAAQPYHEYAWRDKGILEGVISAEKPAAPDLVPGEAVPAKSETEVCPLCGGALAFDAAAAALLCAHCGYQPGMSLAGAGSAAQKGYEKLENALLQRKFGFTREWKIGSRVLVCQNCAAQLTLGSEILSTECPFCGSAHILTQDKVGSFEQPDALLPFTQDRNSAARAVHALLGDEAQQIERGELTGVYLPYWAFAGFVTLRLPTVASQAAAAVRGGVYSYSDVLVAGIKQPSQAVLFQLMPYDFRALKPYETRYLAHWPAEVYSVDVVQASITARAFLKYRARQEATGSRPPDEITLARTDSNAYNMPDHPFWQSVNLEADQIHYRLLLLPVWMVTLIYRGGARRPAVVNGQTGEVVISSSFDQPDRFIAAPNRPGPEPLPPIPLPAPRRDVIRPLPGSRLSPIRPIQPPKR
ncbi:MAG: hypothetical protein HY866_07735, partial [Chloroflexi bacterium]|nr:hypothetical protein [Chloroflexota bacterium]